MHVLYYNCTIAFIGHELRTNQWPVSSCLFVYSFYTIQSATRGTVYGIGQSLGSLGRSVGPLIGEPLFAWSERNGM